MDALTLIAALIASLALPCVGYIAAVQMQNSARSILGD